MKLITKFYNHINNDSLYRNSIFLMMSTGVMAFFGFFFWMINARLFKPEQVGIATALISIMTLISSFSLLGLNNGLIRYLPTSIRKNQKINTSFTLVILTSAVMALIYLIGINVFSPKLLFVRENVFFAVFFVLAIVFSTLNNISESVFIAYRSSIYVLIKNTISSLVKLSLPILLISLGAYGIFASVGISVMVAFVLSLIFLIFKFGYKIRPTIDKEVVERMGKFSLGNYVAIIFGSLPTLILPIMILNNLGAKFSAYFYIDLMIANLLFIVPTAVSQSLFAEGSYSAKELKTLILKALRINFLIIIPAIIITILFGQYILLAFGKQYSKEGVLLLQLFAISSIFISINSMGGALLNIKHKIKLLILVNFVGALLILNLSYYLLPKELLGIGFAWLIGQGIISTIYLLSFKKVL